jgi:uncharacterized protein (DUF885 family)
MILSTHGGSWSDNMKRFLWVVALFLITPSASADPMDTLVAEYEVYVRDVYPEEAARAAGEAPSAWGKVTPEAISERAARAQALRDSIAALETDRTTDQAILERLLSADIDDARFDTARIPFTGDWGFQAEPIFAAMQTTITSEAEGEAWIARLNDVPRYFAENVANMRRGLATGWVAHTDPLKVSTDQIREQISDDPSASGLYVPFLNLPAGMNPAVASRLRTDGLTAVANAISAYRKTLAFIEEDYAPHTRAGAGIAELPGGLDAYAAAVEHHTAGAGYSPEEIHALGEAEVARIRAEMEAILQEIRFEGDFQDFLDFLRTDPVFYAKTPEELMSRRRRPRRSWTRSCRTISASFRSIGMMWSRFQRQLRLATRPGGTWKAIRRKTGPASIWSIPTRWTSGRSMSCPPFRRTRLCRGTICRSCWRRK